MNTQTPIGIFDSGMGGLSHAKAIAERLPHLPLIYIGDIAHFPYGNKTQSEIESYCRPLVEYLLSQHCQTIIVACNTATAAALPLIKAWVGNKAQVIDVVSLIVQHASQYFSGKTLGLIGTEYTVRSGLYENALRKAAPQIVLQSLATPDLVSKIETDIHHFNQSYEAMIADYLSSPALAGIEALILGCTHYPFVKDQISAYYHHALPLMDSAVLVAEQLASREGFDDNSQVPVHQFFMTNASVPFDSAVKYFFNQEAKLLEL